jgi:hypothetical protein
VTGRWENKSAKEMLTLLLQQHKMMIVSNPATSVERIGLTNQIIKPVPASQVGTETNQIVPLIDFDEIPLDTAIKKLAAHANVAVVLDPAILPASPGRTPGGRIPTVTLRWENLSGKQALAALLDNYGLMMSKDPVTSAIRIQQQPPNKPSP